MSIFAPRRRTTIRTKCTTTSSSTSRSTWTKRTRSGRSSATTTSSTIERDTETFISGEGVRPNIPPDPGMIYQDGEQHSKQRALVSSGFTPRQMRKMDDRAREIVTELVDNMLQKDEVDIVEDLAAALPMRLIADMLGHPRREARFGSAVDQRDHDRRMRPRLRHRRGQRCVRELLHASRRDVSGSHQCGL